MLFTKITRLFMLLLLLLPLGLSAETGFFQDVGLDFHGYYWARHYTVSEFDADDNSGIGMQNYMTQELRLYPELKINENITLYMDTLLFSGFLGKSEGTVLTYDVSDKTGNITLKRIYGKVKTPFGVFEVGRMPSYWGLGMVSNDGDHDIEFGDTEFGDTYDRFLFATKPLGESISLTTAVFYDIMGEGSKFPIKSDDLTDIGNNSSDVNQVGFSVTYDPMKCLGTGFYFVYRRQSITKTNIYTYDLYLNFEKDIWHAAFEGALISGSTQAVPILQSDLTITNPEITVNQLGAVLVAGAHIKPLDDLYLRIGYASGDDSFPQTLSDDELTAFSFNKNYKVGLIMFDMVDRYLTQEFTNNYIAALESPISAGNSTIADAINFKMNDKGEKLGELEGAISLFGPSNGAIRNAFFVNPVVKYKPIDDIMLKLGVLGAWADKRVRTREVVGKGLLPDNGFDDVYGLGVNYGWEIDLGAGYNFTENVVLDVQAGYFFPGNVYVKSDGSKPDNVFTIIPRFTINF